MSNTDLELFMAKLQSLIYSDNNSLLSHNRIIKSRKPYFQSIYEELNRSCFKDMTIEGDAGNRNQLLLDAAMEAEETVDMFISAAILYEEDIKPIPNIDYYFNLVIRNLNNMSSLVNDNNLKARSKRAASSLMDKNLETQSRGAASSLPILSRVKSGTMEEHEEVIVGFKEDALSIIDRLTGDRKHLQMISIVGMGGLGKTTLATKIFKDQYVVYYFDIRGWITVSQAYSKRDLLLKMLTSIGKSVHEATSEHKLYEILYKSLKGRKYLIVVDDVWSVEAWNDLGLCFPNDNNGSRVLLTTRITEVACHVRQGGFIHNLQYLTQDQSWELLCRKTFRGYECPEDLIDTGKRIAKRCQGLPLALVVIGGLLEKGEKGKAQWEKVLETVNSYIVNDPKGCLDTLALSYDHLPSHLKKCFLYVGGFPEDYKIQARTLIRLWMAEGFIEAGQRSLEEEGQDYLMDLIDRSLLTVYDKTSNGGVKSCHLHDLLRELCLKKASEEKFFKKLNHPFSDSTSSIENQCRLFTDDKVLRRITCTTHIRSLMCFHTTQPLEYRTTKWAPSFLLLRVLNLVDFPLLDISDLNILIHLRYLAVWSRSSSFLESPVSEANTGKSSIPMAPQTLIFKGSIQSRIHSPDNMPNVVNIVFTPQINANLLNVRHLRCDIIHAPIDSCVPTLFNLQTISRIKLDHKAHILLQSFPNIKKLGCSLSSSSSSTNSGFSNFSLLTRLESLNIERYMYENLTFANQIKFPETLKKLTLKGLRLPWSFMSTIQRLPKLEVLKLLESSFEGRVWDTSNEHFRQLKFLKFQKLNIRFWEASSMNFPRLRKIVVRSCDNLKEIPLVLGNISTLEHIEIDQSNIPILESVNRLQEAQREMGNYDIHVNFVNMDPSEVFFEGDPYFD